jgi:hypothetical protein
VQDRLELLKEKSADKRARDRENNVRVLELSDPLRDKKGRLLRYLKKSYDYFKVDEIE